MVDIEWQPLPALWPQPAVWTDVGELILLVFTQDGVPTWEVSRRDLENEGLWCQPFWERRPDVRFCGHQSRSQ